MNRGEGQEAVGRDTLDAGSKGLQTVAKFHSIAELWSPHSFLGVPWSDSQEGNMAPK